MRDLLRIERFVRVIATCAFVGLTTAFEVRADVPVAAGVGAVPLVGVAIVPLGGNNPSPAPPQAPPVAPAPTVLPSPTPGPSVESQLAGLEETVEAQSDQIGANATATFSNSSDIGDNVDAIIANSTRIDTNFGTASMNTRDIGINSDDISDNRDASAFNAVSIDAVSSTVQTNTDSIATLNTGFETLNASVSDLRSRDDELADGIAISMSLESPDIERDQSFAMRLGYGNFDGESAVGLSAAGVVSRGGFGPTSSVKIDAGIGFGAGSNTLGGKAGVTIGW